jgi:hypothetical protein
MLNFADKTVDNEDGRAKTMSNIQYPMINIQGFKIESSKFNIQYLTA